MNPDKAHKEDAKLKFERMDYELGIIHKTKYDSYFLVVWDFINAAKEIGVPGRPRARFRRRQPGCISDRHHRHRPDPLQAVL